MQRKPYRIKNLILMLPFIFLTGCAVGPYGNDFHEYLHGQKLGDDIHGKISVDDQSGYTKGSINHRENPKLEIIDDIRRESKRNIEEESAKIEFHFIYYKCEDEGLFPTQYAPINLLVHIATLTFWRIGEKKSCRVDLEVKDISSGSIIDSFTSIFEERSGGNILEYSYLGGITARGSWRLPARKLLLQYQEKYRRKL